MDEERDNEVGRFAHVFRYVKDTARGLLTREWLLATISTSLCVPWLIEGRYLLDEYLLGHFCDPQIEPLVCVQIVSFFLIFAAVMAISLVEERLSAGMPVHCMMLVCLGASFVGSAILGWVDLASMTNDVMSGLVSGLCLGAASAMGLSGSFRLTRRFSTGQTAMLGLLAALVGCALCSLLARVNVEMAAIACLTCMAISMVVFFGIDFMGMAEHRICVGGAARRALEKRPAINGGERPTFSPLFKRRVFEMGLRVFSAAVLIGFAFGAMIYIFFASDRGQISTNRALNMTFIGLLIYCGLLFIGWLGNRELDLFHSFRLSCIVAIPAFFPLMRGADYALQFALDFTFAAFVTVATLAYVLQVVICRTLSETGAQGAPIGFAGLACGASLGVVFAYFVARRSPLGEEMVYFSGLISLLAMFVATNMLIAREPLLSIQLIAADRFPFQFDAAQRLVAEQFGVDRPQAQDGGLPGICKRIALEKCLTEREAEVLLVLARGNSLARVQEDLFISKGTAITHRRHIYRKLGVHSRQELLDYIDSCRED